MYRYLLIIPLVLLIGTLGFFLGRYTINKTTLPTQSTTNNSQASSTKNPLFTTQNAAINGEITQVKNNKIIAKNQSGQSGEFELSPNVVIYKISSDGFTSPSADLKLVEPAKNVTINLELRDQQYIVISIAYFAKPL